MSSRQAPATPAESRTIGDILLARGFVSREKLDSALERQRTSGKPLGQILVEEGAISRLELASALAEQWSDIGSVSPDFGLGTGTTGPPVELQELRQSRRVLEERLREWEREPAGSSDTEERERLAARLAGVEAAVAGLQEHDAALEVTRLRQGVEDLAERLDTLAGAVASAGDDTELPRRVDDVDGRLSALGAAVESAFRELERRSDEAAEAHASLAAEVRSAPHEAIGELAQRLTAIEGRLEGLAGTDRVDALAASVGALERAEPPPDLTPRADELQRRIDALADDVAVARALGQRAAETEARLDELAARTRAGESLPGLVDELMARVDALTSRPVADGETDARVAELVVRMEQLSAAVDGAGARPAVDPGLAGRVEALAAQLDEIAERPAGDPALAARLDELAGTLAEVATRSNEDGDLRDVLAGRVDELTAAVSELAARPIGAPEVQAALEALSARLDDVAERPAGDPETTRAVGDLTARLDALEREAAAAEQVGAVLDVLTSRVERLEHEPADADQPKRLQALEHQVAGVAADLQKAVNAAEARGAELEARLEALAARAAEPRRERPPVSVSDALAAAGTSGGGAVLEDVERLRMMVERLMHDFADHRRAVSSALSSREFTALLEELAARVDDLQAGGVVAAPSEDGASASPGPRADVRALQSRLDEVEDSVRASRDGVFQRLERMMGTIDWRLQRLEHPESVDA